MGKTAQTTESAGTVGAGGVAGQARARFGRPAAAMALVGAAWAGGFAVNSLLTAGSASAATTSAAPAHVTTSTSGTSPSSSTASPGYCAPGAGRGLLGPGPLGAKPATAGTVLSVDATSGSFDVLTPQGADVTVKVSPSTKYDDPAASSASLSDVTAGEVVAVQGTTSSGTVTAGTVAVLPAGDRPGADGAGAAGTPATSGAVLGVSSATNSFTLLTPSGATETVNVSSSTKYTEPCVTSASISDLKRGERVVVQGTSSSGTVDATAVLIRPAHVGGPGFGPGPGGRGPLGPGPSADQGPAPDQTGSAPSPGSAA